MIESELQKYLHGPKAVEGLRIIQRLRDAGFIAYFAGGCVRDALLGRTPKDYDVATDATPDAVRELFGKRRTLAFGASFGVIGVLPDKSHWSTDPADESGGMTQPDSSSVAKKNPEPKKNPEQLHAAVEPTEVATFRSDGHYSDGRRPDTVHFGDARNDAIRRDFTINGLFYDPQQGKVIDHVGGREDLAARVLRTIGSPEQRFGEDRLRMLRAIRFAATLQFGIHAETLHAIQQHADGICDVSGERIGAEMRRILASPHAFDGLQQMLQSGLARVVLPELVDVDMKRLERFLHHAQPRSFSLSLACLGAADFEQELDVRIGNLQQISQRWRLSTLESRQAEAAIKHWKTLVHADSVLWSKVQPVLVLREAPYVLGLAEAITNAENLDRDGCELAKRALGWPAERLDPQPLLSGGDLMALGFRPGPEFGKALAKLRIRQLDGEITTRDQAIAALNALGLD